jgi:putative colanic acid biosynthesis acetyltransferase WcaF
LQKLDRFKIPIGFRGRNAIHVQIWWLIQATAFAWSPQFLYSWRRFLLRRFGAEVGKGVLIRPTARITYPWKLKIGDNSWIGDDVDLYTLGEIVIGKNVCVSQRSYICTGSHDYTKESFDIYEEKIVIEDSAWLGTDVFVAPGVNIGEGSVVGARSSVFMDLPAGMICIGSPAKPVRHRLEKL